ncbi:MAG: hypothetical protein HYZ90_01320 [Candidatus Omnitrophica bacterium]|nr:hypothetical protein [Candidatus Omnitrophota bacterium]
MVWGGTAFGVQSIISAPAEVGPRYLVANNAMVSGRNSVPGTMILPEPTEKGREIRLGYVDQTRGRLGGGVEQNIGIRLDAIRLLEVLAQVAAAGAQRAQSDQERVGYRRELALLQSYQNEAILDLEQYLALAEVSLANLANDSVSRPTDKTLTARLEEQGRVVSSMRGGGYARETARARESVAKAVAAATAGGLEEHTMSTIVKFSRPTTGIVEVKEGTPGLSSEWVSRGLLRAGDPQTKPLHILFAAGAFSRFVDSVNQGSPFYAQVARERGRVNDENGASKLAAPLGVSGMGALLRQLETISEVGFRAREPQLVVIVDSPGNRQMLLTAIEEDRTRPNPRIAWDYLNILPAGIPMDQGEGFQVRYRGPDGTIKPLFEYNPATGQNDKPVMRPSGEYGAFSAGIQAAQAAGIDLSTRDIVPIYGDQAMLYSPELLTAAVGHAEEADITGLNVGHRYVDGQWKPSGGVWTQAQWADGTEALVIAERNVRDPQATGVYNPRLDADEQADPQGFPYSAGAPIFNGKFMLAELSLERMGQRLSTKTIDVKTGPETSERRGVFVTELELTEALQLATQHPAGEEPKYKAQMLLTEDRRYHGIKFLENVEPFNQELFEQGRERLRLLLGARLQGDPQFVEISPRAKGFRGEGTLTVTGDVGIVIDRRGLWVYDKWSHPYFSPTLFSAEGRLVLPADPEGNIPLNGTVEIGPETGLEELSSREIHTRLEPVLERFIANRPVVLAMDVDGVTTRQDEVLSDETREVYDLFALGVVDGRILFLTDISPGQLRDRVENRLTGLVKFKSGSFPLSGGASVGHVIGEEAVGVIDRWVLQVSGESDPRAAQQKVLRMDDKRKEHAAGQISDESLGHGFDINRVDFTTGDIVGIDIELDKKWLAERTSANLDVDPRDGWVRTLQMDLSGVGVGENVLATIHRAGSGSITWVPPKGQVLAQWLSGPAIGRRPQTSVFVDDSASNFLDFPDVANWPGTLLYIGAYSETLAANAPNVIQIAKPGEKKPANGDQIAREIVKLALAVNRIGTAAAGGIAGEGALGGKPVVERVLERARVVAGLEEPIQLPELATSRRLVILTPQTVEEGLLALSYLQPASDEKIQVGIIVEHAWQEQEIAPLLEVPHINLVVPIVNLTEDQKTLGEAIVDLQTLAWGKTPAWEPFVVEKPGELLHLGRFLRVPEISIRSWMERVERSLAGTQA